MRIAAYESTFKIMNVHAKCELTLIAFLFAKCKICYCNCNIQGNYHHYTGIWNFNLVKFLLTLKLVYSIHFT